MAIEAHTYTYTIQEIKMTHKRSTRSSTHYYYQLRIKCRDTHDVVYTKSVNKNLDNAWEKIIQEANDMKKLY